MAISGRRVLGVVEVDVLSADTIEIPGPPDNGAEPQGDNWQSASFECELTGRERTTLVFTPTEKDRSGADINEEENDFFSEVYVECSDGADTAGDPKALFVDAEVGILFTLDGTARNLPTPRVKVAGYGYNDDEVAFDFTWEFDCMDIVDFSDLNANFELKPGSGLGLGSMSGHLELVPQPIVAPGPDTHDAEFGDANNVRRRAVHGWFVQQVDANENLVHPGNPIPGTPAVALPASSNWGRPLAQSTTSLVPFLQDEDAVLNADTRN